MANHVSAEKRNRQRLVRTERNRALKSSVRTQVKAARAAVTGPATDDKAAVTTKVVAAQSALDRAASKGVVHPRTAARKKARLARAAHKAATAAK